MLKTRQGWSAGAWCAVVFALLLVDARPARAQEVVTLIQFTNMWKYDQSGLELGIAWRTNDYDDSEWASGAGLLGVDDNAFLLYAAHAPISTPLLTSLTVTTFYFRTTFEYTGSTAGVTLIASNLVDDGCAIYLNGRRAAGVRTPTGPFNSTTTFPGPNPEGQLDVVTVTNTALRQGENLLAVEVHQSATNSSDVMWGMKLMAITPTPLAITEQPTNQTVFVGTEVTLRVGVSGGPASYRWQKEGLNFTSTSNTLVLPNVTSLLAGNYHVIVSNALGSVTSSVARLIVLPDIIGPRVVTAIVDNYIIPNATNTVHVLFSEHLNVGSAQTVSNYSLVNMDTGNPVSITNRLYSATLGVLLRVDGSDPDWIGGTNFILTINNVKDAQGNAIAPGTQVTATREAVSLVTPDTIWSCHSKYFLDRTIYTQPWQSPAFAEDPLLWQPGTGPFCGGSISNPPCSMDCETSIDYQLSPTLFRTSFQWPASLGRTAHLTFNGAVDDGLVLYVNGVEVWRTNAAPEAGTPGAASYADAQRADADCFFNRSMLCTNLTAGSNCLAVAVLQPRPSQLSDQDTAFFLTVDARPHVGPPLPAGPPPTLSVSLVSENTARLSWVGNGYALESTTNLTEDARSYPFGPWLEVTNMSNPYIVTPAANAKHRIFRLKK